MSSIQATLGHGTLIRSSSKDIPRSNEASMSRLGTVMLVAAAALAGTAGSVSAKTIYDGSWSVSIITEKGNCDRGYRYGINIQNGRVIYSGGVVDMRGRVTSNGAVSVRVSRGNQSAAGTGRLGRSYGAGTWRGLGNGQSCSGRWEAERR
jgi:hypothetical protein